MLCCWEKGISHLWTSRTNCAIIHLWTEVLECSQPVTGVAVLLKGFIRQVSIYKFGLQFNVIECMCLGIILQTIVGL